MYAALQWCAHNYQQVAEEVRSLLGATPFSMPADVSVFQNPQTRQTFEQYWGVASAPAQERYKFVKMAWDLLGSDFGARHAQYEKFYGGPPHIMDLYSYFNCPWAERRAAVERILQEMSIEGAATGLQRPAAE